uniref:Uncharacterized protein n=1 Tax=Arundo donax TaxID=35708 RepID=A0A0A9F764_ARUDO
MDYAFVRFRGTDKWFMLLGVRPLNRLIRLDILVITGCYTVL